MEPTSKRTTPDQVGHLYPSGTPTIRWFPDAAFGGTFTSPPQQLGPFSSSRLQRPAPAGENEENPNSVALLRRSPASPSSSAAASAARPARGKHTPIVRRCHEPPPSAPTITALITPSSQGDTKGRERLQRRDKGNWKEKEMAARRARPRRRTFLKAAGLGAP